MTTHLAALVEAARNLYNAHISRIGENPRSKPWVQREDHIARLNRLHQALAAVEAEQGAAREPQHWQIRSGTPGVDERVLDISIDGNFMSFEFVGEADKRHLECQEIIAPNIGQCFAWLKREAEQATPVEVSEEMVEAAIRAYESVALSDTPTPPTANRYRMRIAIAAALAVRSRR